MAGQGIEAEILQWVDQRRGQVVDFARQLIATPSENPPGDEQAMAKAVGDRLRELNCGSPRIASRVAHRPNLLSSVVAPHAGPTLLFSGHLDTKPKGRDEDWLIPPFDPVIREGRLYGLGSSDMKSAIAAMTYAASAVGSVAGELGGELQLVFTADEEAGGAFGAKYLSEAGLLRADVALVGEPSGHLTNWEYLDVVSRGETCFRLRVRGTQMHSSISNMIPSVNANLRLAAVLLRLERDLKVHHEPHPFCPNGITVTPGVMMHGGIYYGILPGEAECSTEIRVIPGMSFDGVRRDVEAFVEMLRHEDPDLRIELEFEAPPLDWIAPVEFPTSHPFLEALETAAQRVLGFRPTKGAFPAWTDARFFRDIAGIPSIPAFGPGLLTVTHRPNEHVATDAIIEAAKIYALAAVLFLQTEH